LSDIIFINIWFGLCGVVREGWFRRVRRRIEKSYWGFRLKEKDVE
jgi:hypothetical protein